MAAPANAAASAASSGGQRPQLGLLTFNVGGLASVKDKRVTMFNSLNGDRAAIILLQETHSRSDAETARWVREGAAPGQPWAGLHFWSHYVPPAGEFAKRGVGILVRHGAPVSDVRVGYTDSSGRLLRLDFEYAGEQASVLNVYAPSVAADRAAFFRGPFYAALPDPAQRPLVIVGGDFNCIMDARDMVGGAASSNRFVGP
jgi:exonuclease III